MVLPSSVPDGNCVCDWIELKPYYHYLTIQPTGSLSNKCIWYEHTLWSPFIQIVFKRGDKEQEGWDVGRILIFFYLVANA